VPSALQKVTEIICARRGRPIDLVGIGERETDNEKVNDFTANNP
jgi:hypothetical protein